MAPDRLSHPDTANEEKSDAERAFSTFLVERYLSASATSGLADSVARVARLCTESGTSHSGIQYLQSTYLPSEDTCFCVFRARSADAVRAINRVAGFAFDRITEAVLLFSDQESSPG
jgi:Protein of unknown function (DUF4242)